MLKPSECFAGSVSAAKRMTLVLPRAQHEYRSLIVLSNGKTYAICLDEIRGADRFMAYECEENDRWRGLHIPGVAIELDETSLYDIDGHYAPAGSMVRTADILAIHGNFPGQLAIRSSALPILEGLPACIDNDAACFLRWQIVLGDGDTKRILCQVDAGADNMG